jgi:hypothetical protein
MLTLPHTAALRAQSGVPAFMEWASRFIFWTCTALKDKNAPPKRHTKAAKMIALAHQA